MRLSNCPFYNWHHWNITLFLTPYIVKISKMMQRNIDSIKLNPLYQSPRSTLYIARVHLSLKFYICRCQDLPHIFIELLKVKSAIIKIFLPEPLYRNKLCFFFSPNKKFKIKKFFAISIFCGECLEICIFNVAFFISVHALKIYSRRHNNELWKFDTDQKFL